LLLVITINGPTQFFSHFRLTILQEILQLIINNTTFLLL